MNLDIFKTYDIRGIYKKDFSNKDAYLIAKAFGNFVFKKAKKKKIIVIASRDFRKSSASLYKNVISGLQNAGANVISAGSSTVPLHYFAVNRAGADGGIMITASHLGPQYNGFKLSLKRAGPVAGLEFYDFIKNQKSAADFPRQSKIIKTNFLESYLRFLKISKNLYKKLTNSKNIVFDSDGDRVYFRDKNRKIIRPDLIACFLAKEYLKKFTGAKIIIDKRSSKVLSETIKESGGQPIFSPAGHVFFKRAMANHKAVFGAELSGHYYFREFFNCDNGLLAAKKIIEIVKKAGQPLEELIKPFKKYYTSGELNFKVKDKNKKLKKIESFYRSKGGRLNKGDGLTGKFKNFWFNIRSSNTEDLLRLNIEAVDEKNLAVAAKELINLIMK